MIKGKAGSLILTIHLFQGHPDDSWVYDVSNKDLTCKRAELSARGIPDWRAW